MYETLAGALAALNFADVSADVGSAPWADIVRSGSVQGFYVSLIKFDAAIVQQPEAYLRLIERKWSPGASVLR